MKSQITLNYIINIKDKRNEDVLFWGKKKLFKKKKELEDLLQNFFLLKGFFFLNGLG